PIQLEMRYREMGRRNDCAQGTGVTKNISGKGILFTTQHTLRTGARVEISVDWPARLDGKTPLRLIIQGRVVRSIGSQAAVAIQRHEFRTRSKTGL
ncbi:MAG: PilZ domain-containing protein, partial [Bryobacteraceae bacterium]